MWLRLVFSFLSTYNVNSFLLSTLGLLACLAPFGRVARFFTDFWFFLEALRAKPLGGSAAFLADFLAGGFCSSPLSLVCSCESVC